MEITKRSKVNSSTGSLFQMPHKWFRCLFVTWVASRTAAKIEKQITPSRKIICSYHFPFWLCPTTCTSKKYLFVFQIKAVCFLHHYVPRDSCMLLVCVCTIPFHANAHYFLSLLSLHHSRQKNFNQKKKKELKYKNKSTFTITVPYMFLNHIIKFPSVPFLSPSGKTHVHAASALVGYHFQTMRRIS